MGLNFFLFPFIVRKIGLEASGIWILVQSLIGYFGLLDVGVGPSLIKYIAQYEADKDQKSINRQIISSIFVFLMIGIVGAAGLTIIGRYFLGYFHIDQSLFAQAQSAVYLTAILMLINFPMGVVRNILAGYQKYDKTAISEIIRGAIGAILTIILLVRGGNLIQLILAGFAGNVAGWLMSFWFIFKETKVSFHPKFLNKKAIKSIFHFGGVVFVINMCTLIIYRIDQLVITYFLGPGFVTFYEAPSKLYRITSQIPTLLVAPILPASSELHTKKDYFRLQELSFRSTKYILALFLAMTIPMVIVGRQILNIWMGPDFGPYVVVLWILIIHIAININYSAIGQVILGMDKARFLLWYNISLAVMNFILSIILVRYYGVVGVALGTTIPFVLLGWIYILRSMHYLKASMKKFAKRVWLKTLPLGGLIFFASLLLTRIWQIENLWQVIIFGLISGGLYLFLFYYTGLENYERNEISHLLRLIVKKVKIFKETS
jgi:O-antigen/teichoic acid export membrane protein